MIVDGYYDIIFRTRNVWSLITELWLGVSLFSDTTVRSCQIQTILKPSIEYKLFSQSVLKHAYWTICVSNYNIYIYIYVYVHMYILHNSIYIYMCVGCNSKRTMSAPHISWRSEEGVTTYVSDLLTPDIPNNRGFLSPHCWGCTFE